LAQLGNQVEKGAKEEAPKILGCEKAEISCVSVDVSGCSRPYSRKGTSKERTS
jgi:hypothetical protein